MEVKHKIKQSGTKMNISNAGKRVIRIKKMKNICTYTKKRKKKKRIPQKQKNSRAHGGSSGWGMQR